MIVRGMRWAARAIGLGAVVWFFLASFFVWIFSEISGSKEIVRFSMWIAITALVGFCISWWRTWLAGVLLIIAWLISLGEFVYLAQVVFKVGMVHYRVQEYLLSGLPLLVAGVLFLLSWWISRETYQRL